MRFERALKDPGHASLNNPDMVEAFALKGPARLFYEAFAGRNEYNTLSFDEEPLSYLDCDSRLSRARRQLVDNAPFPAPNPAEDLGHVFVLVLAQREGTRRRAE
jgi:hypothetical protein